MNTLKNQEMNMMELEQRLNCPKLEFNQKQKKPQIPQKKTNHIIMLLKSKIEL